MAFSASEDLAHSRNVFTVLKVSFWSQTKLLTGQQRVNQHRQRFKKRPNFEHIQNVLEAEKERRQVPGQKSKKLFVCVSLHCWQCYHAASPEKAFPILVTQYNKEPGGAGFEAWFFFYSIFKAGPP